VRYHSAGLVAVAVIWMVHGLSGRCDHTRLIGLGAAAVCAAAFPLILIPTDRFPVISGQGPEVDDGSWRFVVYWAVFFFCASTMRPFSRLGPAYSRLSELAPAKRGSAWP
jgi:hypothetical protein